MPDKSKLKVGDKIRLLNVPMGDLVQEKRQRKQGLKFAGETVSIIREIIERKRPVRIFQFDEYALPWFRVRLKRKRGKVEEHWLAIMENDSWEYVRVRGRTKGKSKRSRD